MGQSGPVVCRTEPRVLSALLNHQPAESTTPYEAATPDWRRASGGQGESRGVAVKGIWVASNPLGIRALIEIKLRVPGMGVEPIRSCELRFLSSHTDVRRRPPTFTVITNRRSWVRQWLPACGWIRPGCRHGCRQRLAAAQDPDTPIQVSDLARLRRARCSIRSVTLLSGWRKLMGTRSPNFRRFAGAVRKAVSIAAESVPDRPLVAPWW